MDKIITVNVKNIVFSNEEFNSEYFIHLFNPSEEYIMDMLPIAIKHSKIICLWVWGDIKKVKNYSFLKHLSCEEMIRVMQPTYLDEDYETSIQMFCDWVKYLMEVGCKNKE